MMLSPQIPTLIPWTIKKFLAYFNLGLIKVAYKINDVIQYK